MTTMNQALSFSRPGLPIRSGWRRPPVCRLSYGKEQELLMRRALRSGDGLDVHYSEQLDVVYKVDAVVQDRNRPLAPATGVQFTTKHDPEKKQRTIDMVRRTGVVPRLCYLEAECRLEESAFELIQTLVRYTAGTKPSQGIVTAVIGKDEKGRFCLRDLCCYSVEEPATGVRVAA